MPKCAYDCNAPIKTRNRNARDGASRIARQNGGNSLAEVIEENSGGETKEKPFCETATDEEWIAELDSPAEFSDKIPETRNDSRESIYREREDTQI